MLNLTNVKSDNWITGAINLDEDIHFSSYYLKRSLDKNIGKIFPGYSKVISLNTNCNEEYFLLEDECNNLSKKLISKMVDTPEWFDYILASVSISVGRNFSIIIITCFTQITYGILYPTKVMYKFSR